MATRAFLSSLCMVIAVTLATAGDDLPVYDPTGLPINDVCGLQKGDTAVHWTVGDSGMVFRIASDSIVLEYTLDGGQYDLHGVSFANTNHGWVVGYKRDDPERWRALLVRTLQQN